MVSQKKLESMSEDLLKLKNHVNWLMDAMVDVHNEIDVIKGRITWLNENVLSSYKKRR